MSYYDDEDEDDVEITPPGTLGRVRYVSADGRHVSIELRNGQVASATSNDPFDFEAGDVVIVRDRALDRAPWPRTASVVGAARLTRDPL